MKLIAAALFVSLIGCAGDNDGEGGAYLFGMRPAKPSLDDPKPPRIDINPAIQFLLTRGGPIPLGESFPTPDGGEVSAELITPPFPIEGLCPGCDAVVLTDARDPGELNLVEPDGQFLCRIWIAEDGHIEMTDCR